MNEISVFLDDYRQAPEGYVLAETIDECLILLKNYEIDHLSLDHDLASYTRNGLMLVKIMVEKQLFANRITIHSANSTGGKAMYNCFKQAQNEYLMPRSINIYLRPMPLNPFISPMLSIYKK
ncbi:cyclic-phosphate processing receiver domain-containing protein [Mesobacillus sp.]|uniref:cyclic-phosphate processing receiver domain-containing protein n=1 Tax=Mesobacillus sp. TaxID=2675271 RepID=UPI0039F0C3D0